MEIAAPVLLLSATALGLRHGIDWDHIAAILDIVGTKRKTDHGLHTLLLASMYALGHAFIVVVLGIAALQFAAILPPWVDSWMERFVGCTLLLLGVWVFYSMILFALGKSEFEIKGRWTLLLSLLRGTYNRVTRQVAAGDRMQVGSYGVKTAFAVGMIHGVGAETGTQVLLIAAVGGAASHAVGWSLLFAFVLGLIISNGIVSLLAAAGFLRSQQFRPMYVSLGILVGSFSLALGSYFMLGKAQSLPNLQQAIFVR